MRRVPAFLLALLMLFGACAVFAQEGPAESDLPLRGVKIGLDPGHQLIYDPRGEPVAPGSAVKKQRTAGGCMGCRSGVMEYEVNLNVALYLREMLTAAGAEVYITHDTLDVNISNRERAEFFNEHEVALAIRLHCNKDESSGRSRGAVMLVPTPAHTDFFVQDIFIALTVLERYCEVTGLPTRLKPGMLEFRDDQAGFNWCKRPVVCLEMGYLSNDRDDKLLSDPSFQKRMAQGIYEGILDCFDHEGHLRVS